MKRQELGARNADIIYASLRPRHDATPEFQSSDFPR